MEKFCEDIAVVPENVVMLVLAYKMNARQMGFFTLAEWLKGLSDLHCDTISKIQQKLEYLKNLLNEPHTFKGIYRYAYDFARVNLYFFFLHILFYYFVDIVFLLIFCLNIVLYFFFKTRSELLSNLLLFLIV